MPRVLRRRKYELSATLLFGSIVWKFRAWLEEVMTRFYGSIILFILAVVLFVRDYCSKED